MFILKGTVSLVVISISLILLNFCLLFSVFLQIINNRAGYFVNRFLANTWGGFCAWWARVVCGVKLHMMCDPPSSAKADHGAAKENAIVIVNHQSMVDMVVYFMFALRFGRIGDTKSFSKESLKYWPGIGWALMMLDVIFVKRNWQSDAKHVIQQFEKIKNRRQPFWVVIFPEGTRITPGKLVVSQEISRQKNLPVLQHVLLPRPKGFITAVTMLKEKIDAVYDVTIHYEEKIPSLLNLMCGQVHNIRIHAKRCAFADLPTCEEELKDWLVQRFVEKDVAMGRLNTP